MITNNLSCTVSHLQQLQGFIYQYNLRPGDAIIVKEHDNGFIMSLLDHYVVYLGDTLFMANYKKGVEVLDCPTIFRFLPSMRVDRIRRFTGNDHDRRDAVERALAKRDQRSYHLIVQNCEHFANEVQYGIAFSDQALIAGTAAALGGLALLNGQNEAGKILGSVLLLAGGAVAAGEMMKRG